VGRESFAGRRAVAGCRIELLAEGRGGEGRVASGGGKAAADGI
jgi:hypothetical protein